MAPCPPVRPCGHPVRSCHPAAWAKSLWWQGSRVVEPHMSNENCLFCDIMISIVPILFPTDMWIRCQEGEIIVWNQRVKSFFENMWQQPSNPPVWSKGFVGIWVLKLLDPAPLHPADRAKEALGVRKCHIGLAAGDPSQTLVGGLFWGKMFGT